MWRCSPLLSWALRGPSGKKARRGSRASGAGEPSRDALGMIIPEARLRRRGLSLDDLDRAVEERARGILGTSPALDKRYGAHWDRREVRFQGRAGDLRRFAEMAARSQDSHAAMPPNAVAFVRKAVEEKRKEEDPHKGSAKESKSSMDGGDAVLRRAFRGSAMADRISTPPAADVDIAQDAKNNPKQTAPVVSEARRRVERRMRRMSRAASSDGPLHPCLHQGGCPSRSQPALCPFALHPAAMCAVWLRDGHCDAALNGRCPFWHGSVSSTSRRELTEGRSLFPTEADTAGMAALLQMFVDAVIAGVEEAGMQQGMCEENMGTEKGTEKDNDSAVDSGAHSSAVLCALRNVSAAGIPVHYNASTDSLYANRGLAASALEGGMDSFVDTTEPYGEANDRDNEAQEQDGEQRLYRLLDTFRGYAVAHDTFVFLTPKVTRWVISRVQQYFISNMGNKEGSNEEFDTRVVLRDAATALLRFQLEESNLMTCHAVAQDGPLVHRWAALSLLQHMMLLAHCSKDESVSLLFSALERAAEFHNPAARRSTVHAQFLRFWAFAQTILSVIARNVLGANESREGFFTLVRPALLAVTKQIAQDVETRFAGPLLRAAGWAPWTDAQMFAPQHAAAYSAASYAETHQPLFSPAFVVFALNVFLLHALRLAVPLTRGSVSRAFFDPLRPTEKSVPTVVPQASLRAALSLLSALQDENAAGESVRAGLRADFVARRQTYFERCAAEERRHRPRTRRYGPVPFSDESAEDSFGGGGSRLDQLLPPGSAAVSPDAVALLIAALLHGKAPYKALRIAASAVRAGRLLRRAALYERTELSQKKLRGGTDGLLETHRTVHRRVTDRRTGRRRVVRTRERVLRDPAAEEKARDSLLRPIGLHLCVDAAVVVEAARVGLRMGEAGERLARGVTDDCFRGAIADHSRGRCLAVPHVAEVPNLFVTEESGAGALRTILAIATGRKDEAAKSVRPNARLLEVLVALTPGSARDTHGRYERCVLSNPRELVNDRVLLAQQYHAAQHNFARAGEVAAIIWSDAVKAGEIALDSRATHTALVNELYRLPSLEQNSHVLGSGASLAPGAWAPRTVADLREHLEDDGNSKLRSFPHDSQSLRPHPSARTGVSAVHAGGYVSYVATCVSAATDASRLRWAVASGALLALDAARLGGPQRVWSRLLLRNAFLLAPRTPGHAQATVRVLLTTDALREAPTARQRPPWERKPGNALAAFVAAQMRLLTELKNDGNMQQQNCRQAAQSLRGVQGLDDANGLAWDLLEPFISHPEIAAIWLRESFLAAPKELMEWVIAGVHTRDKQALISLACWTVLRQHYWNNKSDLLHDRVMKIVVAHCDQARVQDFNHFACDITTKSK